MAAETVTLSGNVFEMLTGHNYERWSVLMRNYLIGEGLWEIISRDDVEQERFRNADPDLWNRRNGKALFAIQLSCTADIFKTISDVDDAREAWSRLISLGSDAKGIPLDLVYELDEDWLRVNVQRGNWYEAEHILMAYTDRAYATNASGKTVLHIAVIAGHEHIVENLLLLARDKPELEIDRWLEMRDKDGYTALALAAQLNGNTKMAKGMVEMDTDLVSIPTEDGQIPLILSSGSGHKELTRYLDLKTPRPTVLENAAELLSNYITAEMFDLAYKFTIGFGLHPETLQSVDNLHRGGYYRPAPLLALASIPYVFRSGCRLNWWQRALYPFLRLPYALERERGMERERVLTESYRGGEVVSRESYRAGELAALARSWRYSQVGNFIHDLILLKVSAIKELYDKKRVHVDVHDISSSMGYFVRRLNEPMLHQASVYDAMLQAAKYGIVEFIESMSVFNPDLLWTVDRNKRGIFSHAILNRQEKLFKYLLDNAKEQMRMISPRQDVFGNNLLHQAAELGPSSDLDCRFGAALQMQSEIRWFKVVEKNSHPACKEATNARGKKPREVFTESHKGMMEAGEKWAKDAARSFTIVCTLIITITFAAAFTVPGGTNQDAGIPIFLKKTLFKVFILADAASLVTSSSSVLISVVILTSRYTQRDFVTRLPIMLMANLLFLFMSVAGMMAAFCAGIAMMLTGYRSLVIAAISLASLPIMVFIRTQLHLFFKIAKSTIGLKGLKSILLLPYNVFILILTPPYIVVIYLVRKIKGLGIFCHSVFAPGANFLRGKCCGRAANI